MSKSKLGQIEVQYFLFLYTVHKKTLQADRKIKEDPKLTLSLDEDNEELIFSFSNLFVEDIRKNPSYRLDIYILVSEAKKLFDYIKKVKDLIINSSNLDRQIREVKDPQITYDNSRVPLRIDKTAGNFKIKYAEANLNKINQIVIWDRDKETDQDPYMNVDLEINKTRLHFGMGSKWSQIQNINNIDDSFFEFTVSWSEFGQLYNSLESALENV